MKISIITVCYNSEKTIEQTIQSVLAQKYDDLEYIIIDGGSIDGTLDIIEQYRDSVSAYISEADEGIYDAMNKGLRNATGDIVAFLNSDDWYAPDVLKRVNRYFEDYKVDIISGNIYSYKDGQSRQCVLDRAEKEAVFFRLLYPQPALFVKRALFFKIGNFNTSYKIAADTDWIMRAYIAGADILCVDDYFTYFRVGGISSQKACEALEEQYRAALSNTRENHMLQMERRIKDFYHEDLKHMEQVKTVRKVLEQRKEDIRKLFEHNKAYYIWGTGIRGKECLELFEQLDIEIKGFIDSNKKRETECGYFVFLPEEIESDANICVTPKNYAKEIIKQLKELGVNSKRFFTYSELMDKMVFVGRTLEDE